METGTIISSLCRSVPDRALAGKGREIAQFQQQTDALLRAWRDVSDRGSKTGKAPKGEVTPLWGYYQPILKANRRLTRNEQNYERLRHPQTDRC